MWDNWNRSTTAQARAQDISNVLDSNYVPLSQEARDLFIEQQKFMYAVFEKTLLTDKGKALVQHYQTSYDDRQFTGHFLHMPCSQPRQP